MLKQRRLYYANNRGRAIYYTRDFNCWGATAFVLGIEDKLKWIEEEEMIDILDENTIIIETEARQRGDILTIYDGGGDWLSHTAVYLGRGKFFHKRGRSTSEITDIGGIVRIYGNDKIEYRRVR